MPAVAEHQERSRVGVTMQTRPLGWHVWRCRLVRGISIAVVLLLLSYGPYRGWQTCQHLLELRAHLYSIRSLSPSNLDSLGANLAHLQRDVTLLKRDFSYPLAMAPNLGWVPLVGPTLQAGPVVLSAGESLLWATATVWEVVQEPVVAIAEGASATNEALTALSTEILAHDAQLEEAASQVHEVCELIGAIDASRLVPQLSARMSQLQSVTPLLTAALDCLILLPDFISQPGDRTFLLLAQNNDELRPTGGFISSIGTLTVAQGIPRFGSIVDSYQVEDWSKPHPDPPEALREYMQLDLWATRDANWWPDFPTSAQAVAELYELNQGQQIDGVLATDMTAAVRLLEVLTPLVLPSGERLESGQVAEGLQNSWSLPPGSLVTSGVVITATKPFSGIELKLIYGRRGTAWFDTVVLEDLWNPGVNLVRNPSFEEDADYDRLPDHWQAIGLATGDHLVTDYAHSGDKSLLIRGDPDAKKAVVQRISYSGPSGASFRLSAESRGEEIDIEGGPYALSAAFVWEEGEAEATVAGFPCYTHDWATAGSDRIMSYWWHHRKDFLNQAVEAALSKLLSHSSAAQSLEFLAEIGELFDERHIQIYMADPSLQAIFQRHGWTGEVARARGDQLLIVDANVGFNKVSARVEQSVDYRVEIDPSRRVRSTLSIRYHNRSTSATTVCDKWKLSYEPNYEALTQGCYWDYVRVYVPAGAELQAGRGGDEPMKVSSELGRTVFATSLVLRPGEQRELHIEYLLPDHAVSDGHYTLTLQKQAGTDNIPVRICIDMPRASKASYEGLQPDELTPDSAIYQTDLLADRHIVVRLPGQ